MNNDSIPLTRIPVATYRLQFNHSFTFADARSVAGYLSDLGISDVYSSPCFAARPGSSHGYDIVDYNRLNPELGSEDDYEAFVGELQGRGMGLLLDIVPNHMCIASDDNAWWTDVLENGPGSHYADFFDIEWTPLKRELRNKVLIPTLGDQFGTVLEDQQLRLKYDDGAFFISYYERTFPVRPRTYAHILKHGLDNLGAKMPADDPHLAELLSIINALSRLPTPLDRHSRRVDERYREKQVIQRHLSRLCVESHAIRRYVDECVAAFNGTRGECPSFDHLDRLLREQVYRLSYWRVATEEINYRRFFDINDLAAIRMEDPAVYRTTHELLLRLVGAGKVTGLRVDHADGLYNPAEYLRWLQRDCWLGVMRDRALRLRDSVAQVAALSGDTATELTPSADESEFIRRYQEMTKADPVIKPFFIVAEKILTKGERIPDDWPVYSTTGYVFLNSVSGIFINSANEKAFDEIHARFTKEKVSYSDAVYDKKKVVMNSAMSSEINTLAHHLQQLSEIDRHTRDFTLNSLRTAISEVIALFPAYRTYINSSVVSDRDRRYIEMAVSKARRKSPVMSASVYDFLRDVLLLRFPDTFAEERKNEWLNFVMRFQQLTGPIMAKGAEDTACYTYTRFVSLNEVGGMPDRFGTPLETFHGQNIERMKYWPHALITTATHDTKRGEDTRARLNVLSEFPEKWKERVLLWTRTAKKRKIIVDGRRVPDRNEEYLLYQTLAGTWPVGSARVDTAYADRIKTYMNKALREAKVNTSWINPDPTYEDGVAMFIDSLLSDEGGRAFRDDFVPFVETIADAGMYNSLSQTLLKICSPGVPDFYQGTELWDFCLVDPDNRRPVDFSLRMRLLEALRKAEEAQGTQALARELLVSRRDGRIKMFLMHKALRYRNAHRELFDHGEYLPLEIMSGLGRHVCAFARRLGNRVVVVAVPRLVATLLERTSLTPCDPGVWGETAVVIPFSEEGRKYRSCITGEEVTVGSHGEAIGLKAADLFSTFPAALFERITGGDQEVGS